MGTCPPQLTRWGQVVKGEEGVWHLDSGNNWRNSLGGSRCVCECVRACVCVHKSLVSSTCMYTYYVHCTCMSVFSTESVAGAQEF